MKKINPEQTLQPDSGIDAGLARMAEDVPPMPADFHSKWMDAVRAEAEKAAPQADRKTPGKPVSLARWTRILSVAAVFLFLIGGTLLYRSTGRSRVPVFSAKEAADGAAETGIMAAGAVLGAEPEEAVPEEYMTDAMEENAAADAGWADEAPLLFAGAEPASEADGMAMNARGGAQKSAAKAADAAAVPAPTLLPEEPEPEIEQFAGGPEEEEGEEAEEVPAEERAQEADAGLLREAGAFLKDMGAFLLAALPYLAVLAVPAVTALVIRRRKK